MKIRWIALSVLIFAVIPERLYALPEKSNTPESIEPWNQLTATVNDNVYLSWKFLVFPLGIRVSKGEYKISQEVIIDDKRYGLIPAMTLRPNGSYVWQYSYESTFVQNCFYNTTSFLAVDIATGLPLNRAFEIKKPGNSYCSKDIAFPYALEKPAKLDNGSGIVLTKQFQSESEYLAHLQDIKNRQENAKKEQYKLKAANNDSKRKIGARVCKQVGSIVYIGFTENTSPDNGKIQVRISDARFGGKDGSSESNFKESIIWEDPTLWDLCE